MMQEEVRLYRTVKDREEIDNLAELYSIFVATENLEKAYVRDLVSSDQYYHNSANSLRNL